MKKIKPSIPNPCSEDWDKMKIGLNSRFCDSCTKHVIDFTSMKREEILKYLLVNADKKVCGHLFPSQLDFSNIDVMVTINALTPRQRRSNLPFYIMTIGSIMVLSCNNPEINNAKPVIEKFIIEDTIKGIEKIDSITEIIDTVIPPTPFARDIVIEDTTEIVLEGDIVIGDVEVEDYSPVNDVYMHTEKMPEFPGGIDSLIQFIKINLQYPKWEKENKIEGKVYVRFVVGIEGEILDVKILRSVEGSKNFDTEVIRVINSMQNWIPGEQDGEKVKVQFTLPVNFKL
jgi:TonB family protein|tara:strand:+ start:173 stop:1030 length:858 start_codon:yes stop_codon:yes gene_type:complete